MKIMVPLDNNQGLKSKVCSHFGRAPYFAVISIKNGEASVEVIENPRNKGIKPGELALKLGVDGVVVKDIGFRALDMLRSAGIEVYACNVNTLEEVIEEAKKEGLVRYSGKGCRGFQEH